jgi:hypothetical protein
LSLATTRTLADSEPSPATPASTSRPAWWCSLSLEHDSEGASWNSPLEYEMECRDCWYGLGRPLQHTSVTRRTQSAVTYWHNSAAHADNLRLGVCQTKAREVKTAERHRCAVAQADLPDQARTRQGHDSVATVPTGGWECTGAAACDHETPPTPPASARRGP